MIRLKEDVPEMQVVFQFTAVIVSFCFRKSGDLWCTKPIILLFSSLIPVILI